MIENAQAEHDADEPGTKGNPEFFEYDDTAEIEETLIANTKRHHRGKNFHGDSRLEELLSPGELPNPKDFKVVREAVDRQRNLQRRRLRQFKATHHGATPELDETNPSDLLQLQERIRTQLVERLQHPHEKSGPKKLLQRTLNGLGLREKSETGSRRSRTLKINFKEIDRFFQVFQAALAAEGIDAEKDTKDLWTLKGDDESVGTLQMEDSGKAKRRIENALRTYQLYPLKLGDRWVIYSEKTGTEYATITPLPGVDLDKIIQANGDHNLAITVVEHLKTDGRWKYVDRKEVLLTQGAEKKPIATLPELNGWSTPQQAKETKEENSKGTFTLKYTGSVERSIQRALQTTLRVIEDLRCGDLFGRWIALIDEEKFEFPGGDPVFKNSTEQFLTSIKSKKDRGKKLKAYLQSHVREHWQFITQAIEEAKKSIGNYIQAQGKVVEIS